MVPRQFFHVKSNLEFFLSISVIYFRSSNDIWNTNIWKIVRCSVIFLSLHLKILTSSWYRRLEIEISNSMSSSSNRDKNLQDGVSSSYFRITIRTFPNTWLLNGIKFRILWKIKMGSHTISHFKFIYVNCSISTQVITHYHSCFICSSLKNLRHWWSVVKQ